MLNSFFCFRLKTAGVIIGWLEVVGALLGVLIIGIIFAYANEIATEILKQMKSQYTHDDIVRLIYVLGSIQLLISAIQLISSSMLLAGTANERHLFLLPWLVNNGISLLFTIVVGIVLLVNGPAPQGISVLLVLPLRLYIWLAIKSLYTEIKEDRQRGRLITPVGVPVRSAYTTIQ